MDPVVFARQPIFDSDLNAVGYELLYRKASQDHADFIDGEHATARVVVGAIVDVGLDVVVGEHPAFINVTRALLCGERLQTLPAQRVVLEILEDIEIDDEVVDSCRVLKALGYTFALDDFVFREGYQRLIGLVSYVKLDVMALGMDGIRQAKERLAEYTHLTLVAEKIETKGEFAACKQLGFTMFQGYFLARPSRLEHNGVAPARHTLLRLVARVYDPDVTLQEIERIISSDVGLSYRILRIINSAYYHLPRKVNSVRQAVSLLGMRFTRTWVSLIALADLGDAPAEIVTAAAVRAKFCERLAQIRGLDETDAYYISGLFSMLDAIMDRPLEDVVSSLPLTGDIKQALLGGEGPIGAALSCVLAHEHADWGALNYEGLDEEAIQQAYLEALAWAFRTREALWAAVAA